jgi:hypothetical protein
MMEMEVTSPRRGELRTRDVRAVFGPAFLELDSVSVLVLDQYGSTPIATTVELIDMPGGRGAHRAFVCQGCREPRRLLLARQGKLQCRTCHRFRSRHQAERTLADWRRRGGREEDALFRLLRPGPALTITKVTQAIVLAKEIVAADRMRLTDLQENVAAVRVAVATSR